MRAVQIWRGEASVSLPLTSSITESPTPLRVESAEGEVVERNGFVVERVDIFLRTRGEEEEEGQTGRVKSDI